MKQRYLPLVFDSTNSELAYVIDWFVSENFDITRLWKGELLDQKLPSDTRLIVGGGEILPDVIRNPLSWLIVSSKCMAILSRFAKRDFQCVDAPLYRKEGFTAISGFSVINVTTLLSCINFQKSTIVCDDSGSIRMISPLVLAEEVIPRDVHLFRITGYHHVVYISQELLGALLNENVQGIKLK